MPATVIPQPSSPSARERDVDAVIAASAPGDNAAPFSISEFSALLKRAVEDRFGFVRLRGELSGIKRAATGHLYCCLKDAGAVIDGVMWRTAAQRLAFVPEDGVEVIASGRITTYPGRSRYQIVIERMEVAGEGALLALLARTKARLAAEGLFDPARKRPLPFAPRVIGIVTSPTGAVIRDILHRLADRFPCRVLVWPVAVQGQGAALQVAEAVGGFSTLAEDGAAPRPDLVIVARGGGSIEDLWAFNEEIVARAIAASSIPVISAVGHETDTTLADFAADLRAPTPTAAAELAVPVRADLALQVADLALRQRRCALRPVGLGRERLDARARRLPRPEALLGGPAQRLDLAAERLRRGLETRAARAGEALRGVARPLAPALLRHRAEIARERLARCGLTPRLLTRGLELARGRLAAPERVLPQLDPHAPLRRGFARVLDRAGRSLASAAAARDAGAVRLRFADGELPAHIGEPNEVGEPAAPPAPRRPRGRPTPANQGDLF